MVGSLPGCCARATSGHAAAATEQGDELRGGSFNDLVGARE